ncbi:SDR family oxidoreductase [Flavisphingomonas formosensis]|uniref:SDR family oxidoreductase n=1 Tax=Flavisphingomonas formosensis TaxID=861534 RepID=UPI0012FB0040|nr:SDR family oxidoreductase [Sphingomonas formosensis]
MLLPGKVLIIAGAGPGLGRRMALLAAGEGARVVLAAQSRNEPERIAAEVRAAGGEAIARVADVGTDADCKALAAATLDRFGRIDCLVNNAFSTASSGPFEEALLDQWMVNMNITCFGALRMVDAVLPAMKAQGGGAIVTISSKAAVQHVPGQSAYAVAKAALEGATRQLASELGMYNIRVNCARPGWMWGITTETFLQMQADANGCSVDDLIAPVKARMPLGRIPTDEDCAKAVLFLASDFACALTGVTLDVNGGERMST